ncbi:MAG TPA: class I SAM-dependent methyltransferase [Pyrinomonadaceae bacterium]|nr:class I SAM-dependent methyltransferase [Pyrinomonadaceae bacterium]
MSEVLREWNNNAAAWRENFATIRTSFAPVTRAMIEEAGISAGQSVVDVAGGPGEPSLTIAEVVGPTGSVTHTDAVADMVAAAEEEARRRGITNVQFRQALADALPFADNSFDVAVSRMGVMFFPDVVGGLREMLRVVKPQGVICLAVWGLAEQNPFTNVVTKVMSRYVEMPAAEPDAPGAFRFGEPGKLARLLEQAGATSVRERELNYRIEAPISTEEYWHLRSATSGTLREKLAKLPPELVAKISADVKEAASEYFASGHMSFPAEMLIVSARKL